MAAENLSRRLTVWKHDCIKSGQGTAGDGSVIPCNPLCDDPWQVDSTDPADEKTFATFAEAIDHVRKVLGGLSLAS